MAAVAEQLVGRYIERDGALWDDQLCVSEQLTDELIAYAYLRLEREGLLPYLFYEGRPPGIKWFMEEYRNREVLGCFKREPDGNLALFGLTWLNCKVHVGKLFCKAEAGQAFFRAAHNRRDPARWMRLSARYAFRNLGVDYLFGTTPVKNRAAVMVAKRAGFQVIAEIPHYTAWQGEECAVMLTCMTPERLEETENGRR